ncbi:hypothetical protein GH714_043412 [Hevea brasiliensis]|uniref:Uncharacterized protein n=1 Tax=Hevea brasiliensis TaxID=3981 RepID=A0A6A6K6P4_HEVBR|nr:hypothetical protein GH714_043412 [Hevea brasiliensis]
MLDSMPIDNAFVEASSMAPFIFLFVVANFFANPFSLLAQPANPTSSISVVGVVYCDTCSTNTFSRYSYFLPGVDVHIQCKFNENSPKTAEQINFSVNRTTDRYGTYNLEVPQIEGVDCVDGAAIESLCQASLINSSSSACDVPGLKTTTNEISVKSKQDNHCIYSLDALSYRPATRNDTLCGNYGQKLPSSFNSSKFFLPPLPPYPRLPLTTLPPLPSLPFPFPPLPPFPPTPSLFQPPPPPAFNLEDPRTWIPHIPSLSPPPPPAFNLRDPRTWIPHLPPPPPNRPQNQNP